MPPWTTATCETNRIRISYTRTGGINPPIVLLHGLAANGACWTLFARTLEGGYDIIMPDARGHGKSSAPEHGYQYEDHANDVDGLVRTLELSDPVLIGHSMGGLTAAVVASRNPNGYRGLVLADPTFLNENLQREVYKSNVVDQHRRMMAMSIDQLLAGACTKHPNRDSELIELIARARLETSTGAFEVLIPPNPDYRRLVRSLDLPTLLVTSETGVVSPTLAAELQALNPKLRIERIPKAGHGLHYDQPERFATIVGTFLRSIRD